MRHYSSRNDPLKSLTESKKVQKLIILWHCSSFRRELTVVQGVKVEEEHSLI